MTVIVVDLVQDLRTELELDFGPTREQLTSARVRHPQDTSSNRAAVDAYPSAAIDSVLDLYPDIRVRSRA